MRNIGVWRAFGVLGWMASGCGGGSICSGAELEAALEGAVPGSTVTVGDCRVEGAFTLAGGVTLRGQGPQSVLAGSGTVLSIEGEGGTVESLRIESEARQGIVAVDAASVTIRDVEVSARLGYNAVGLARVAVARLERVTLTGPVTPDAAASVPTDPGPTDTAMYGIALLEVDDAVLTDVSARGFGRAGALIGGGNVSWSGGSLEDNLRYGAWISGGSTRLEGVAVRRTLRGLQLYPTIGVMALDAALTSTDLTVEESAGGFGMLHYGGRGVHEGLALRGHAAGGLLAQDLDALEVRDADVSGNEFAGVIAVRVDSFVLEGSVVEATELAVQSYRLGSVRVGDGVHLVAPAGDVTVRATAFDANGRAGVLADLGGGDTASFTLEDVTVNAPADAYGFVVQNGATTSGWDGDVSRTGAAATADAGFGGGLDVFEGFERGELPADSAFDGAIAPIM
ncbi:MAG: hypothetical protein M5U28_21940 [Sandaracinaceae bacterium]|nr:hypothetical protein [Sandaracinaceae bacterium]